MLGGAGPVSLAAAAFTAEGLRDRSVVRSDLEVEE